VTVGNPFRDTAANRRRTARVRSDGVLHASIEAVAEAIEVRDLSFGGFSATLPSAVVRDRMHDVAFRPANGQVVRLRVRVAYCRATLLADAAPIFVTGFEFIHEDPDSRSRVNQLIGLVAAELGFTRVSG
jgi:hypothetical protein